MSDEKQSREVKLDAGRGAASSKKLYRKPDFQFEQVFETNALSCGKINNSQGSCHFNRKLS